MRTSVRYVVLAACLALAGSVAEAQVWSSPQHRASKKAKRPTKVAPAAKHHAAKKARARVEVASRDADVDVDAIEVLDEDEDFETPRKVGKSEVDEIDDEDVDARIDDDDDVDAPVKPRKITKKLRRDEDADSESERVAFAEDAIDDDHADVIDAPVRLRKRAAAPAKEWNVAIGPYLWASSVDANVSLGSASVATGVDFMEIERHARYGAEVLAEARYRRFSITGDLMYGVVAVNGAKEVGPLMVTLDGSASSLLVDGAAGYRLLGDDHSLLSLETRAGIRYQRTAIAGRVDVGGGTVASPESVDAGGDAIAGARAFLRPSSRFYVSGMVDLGVFGSSNSTWSASADASVRVTSRLMLSLGWRTLTIDRAQVAMTMHGPRAAVQLLF